MTCYGPPSRSPRASRCARRVCVGQGWLRSPSDCDERAISELPCRVVIAAKGGSGWLGPPGDCDGSLPSVSRLSRGGLSWAWVTKVSLLYDSFPTPVARLVRVGLVDGRPLVGRALVTAAPGRPAPAPAAALRSLQSDCNYT